MNSVEVLDKGYVRLVDYMGDELTVVNAARVSFDKESAYEEDGSMRKKDIGLIKFLAQNMHTSPFRHCFLQFEVYAPLMVVRQWWKYVVGSDHTMDAHNESSRRYVTEDAEFYIPDEWRSAPENAKQGSGAPIEKGLADFFTEELHGLIAQGEGLYELALHHGVSAEQARLFLPAYGLYVRWRWSASLQSVLHFLSQRMAHDSQKEIAAYAKGVYSLVQPIYPNTFNAWPGIPNQ